MADLITQDDLGDALAPLGLPAAQQALLPALAAAASRLIRDWCGRKFTRAVRDELYTVDPRSPLVLRECPVNAVLRLASGPTTVLTIRNGSAAVQRSTAALAASGDADSGLTVTGITLSTWSSGVAGGASVPFTTSMTIRAVAAAVNALGNGWSATTDPTLDLWPAADLRAPQGVLPASGVNQAEFKVHADDLAFELDPESGIVDLATAASGDPWSSPRWGPTASDDDGDVRGGFLGVRCVYDAGFTVVPESIRQACAEAVKAMLERLQTDSTLAGETDGAYGWTAGTLVRALPDPTREALHLYKDNRA